LVTAQVDAAGVEVGTLPVRWLGEDRVSVDGQAVTVRRLDGDHVVVRWRGRSYRLQRPPPLRIEDTIAERGAAGGGGRLSAPMPGRIARIAVEVGERVRSNQPLLVLEAMKMEHIVDAPHAGVVQQVCVEVGQQVAAGAVLLELGSVE
jgi:3-methylcrotonyl-CoA carboxylase alpha subunit